MKLIYKISQILAVLSVTILFLQLASPAQAEWINVCGSGTAADWNRRSGCELKCNQYSMSCANSSPTVRQFSCNGRVAECRENPSGWTNQSYIGNPGCGKTIQIDVFREANYNNLIDYMVWYTGDCPASPQPSPSLRPTPSPSPRPSPTPSPTPSPSPTPTPTPSPIPQRSSCDSLKVTGGNNSLVPAKVTFRASGSDNKGSIQRYKFYFGDGKQEETDNPEIQHSYDSSGSFLARVDVKDSQSNWKTSSSCETSVYVKASNIESHRSDCSDVFITANNGGAAPSTVKFEVTGYDNKGSIQQYRLDYGSGSNQDSSSNQFEKRYDTAGTFTIRAYIKDSEGNWQGGDGGCQRTLYISTKPLTTQPSTGTPTLLTILGLGSGLTGFSLLIARKIAQR